ncbi:MAG: hypothetical protein J6R77_05515 [Clostridia bacterium]|nr:hypothetical protein [Clostridia bacterium]
MQHRSLKAFGGAFLLTLCGVLLAGGILLADLNSRRVTFGDATPPYAATGGEGLRALLQNEELPPFLPPHWQPLYWLWEGEQWLFRQLLNR